MTCCSQTVEVKASFALDICVKFSAYIWNVVCLQENVLAELFFLIYRYLGTIAQIDQI